MMVPDNVLKNSPSRTAASSLNELSVEVNTTYELLVVPLFSFYPLRLSTFICSKRKGLKQILKEK
jgi:hypothetical protein